jgi:hypothetical protein
LHGIETLSLISWASGGHQLTFQTSASTNGPVVVRLLRTDDPGHDLLADSRPVVTFMTSLSTPHNCIDSFVVAGNGQLGTSCQMPGDLALFWANDAGTAVLGYSGYSPEGESTVQTVGQFGLFTKGKFTPLPAPLESFQGYPSVTAW